MTAAFPARATLHREQASLTDPDQATQQTVERMKQHVAAAAADPALDWACSLALQVCGPDATPAEKAATVWWWIKNHVRFKSDDSQMRQVFGQRDELELLISPSVLLRMSPAAGDCDDFTMLACAILQHCGIDCQIVTVAADANDRTIFSHVYAEAVLPDRTMTFDASHGKFPGWGVPARRIYRKETYPLDMPAPRFKGLHGLKYGGVGAMVCDESECWDDGTSALPPPVYTSGPLPPNPAPYTPAELQAVSQANAYQTAYDTAIKQGQSPSQAQIWANTIAGMFKSAVPLIQQATLPTGAYVQTTPYGTVISNQVPGAVPSASVGASFSMANLSSMMPILLIGGGLLVVMMMFGGKR